MIEQPLIDNPFLATIIYAVASISDYYLTIYGVRLYQAGIKDKIVYEGGYELTPLFQHDIDNQKMISWRFVIQLVFSLGLILTFWWVFVQRLKYPDIFIFISGGFILKQVPIHLRHIRNITIFKYAKKTADSLRGRIEYSRQFSLMIAFIETSSFAMLFLVIFAITKDLFILGGVLSCWAMAGQYRAIGKKEKKQLQKAS